MIKSFPFAKFEEWQNNLIISDDLPGMTTSAVIELSELRDFISQIKPPANAVCVNLLRFTWKVDEPQGKRLGSAGEVLPGCEWGWVKNGKTQIAIAISAAELAIDNDLIASGMPIIDNKDEILLLIPGGEKEGPTGHNPPPKTPAKPRKVSG